MIVKRFISVYKAGGLLGVLRAIVRRIRTPHARSFPKCRQIVGGRTGIEIGGPSPIFAWGGLIPVYTVAGRIDNVNFAVRTIWQGAILEGNSFNFNSRKAPGQQFVEEGADLSVIPSETYDFVLSSHMLEHTANPLRALAEWKRVLKPGGGMVLVVPARDATFDHRRPLTPMSHLIEDFEAGIGEDDLTHLSEVIRCCDLSRDSEITDESMFCERAKQNHKLRSIHHHVFDTRLATNAVLRAEFELEAVEPLLPYHIIIVARKPSGVRVPVYDENMLRMVLRKSPFPSDREGL